MATAGKYRHQLEVQAISASKDSLGQRVQTWATISGGTVWGEAEPLTGRELFAAGQMQAVASVRFRIRYMAGITPDMRIVWTGVPHAIVAPPIDVGGRGRELEILCAAGMRDGQ